MIVCEHCLKAIQSREGKQIAKDYEIEDGGVFDEEKEEVKCEWCNEYVDFTSAKVI